MVIERAQQLHHRPNDIVVGDFFVEEHIHVETVPQFHEELAHLTYDPVCASLFTGIRAIWHSWRSGRLANITALGLNAQECARWFERYEEYCIVAARVSIDKDEQVERMLAFVPKELGDDLCITALFMCMKYKELYAEE